MHYMCETEEYVFYEVKKERKKQDSHDESGIREWDDGTRFPRFIDSMITRSWYPFFIMLLIFSIPAYYILLPFVREPRWNREIEAIAGEHARLKAIQTACGNRAEFALNSYLAGKTAIEVRRNPSFRHKKRGIHVRLPSGLSFTACQIMQITR